MCTRQWAFSIVCSLTVMTAIGCYSHYPSSVYGPGGQPGGYTVPPGGGYPQGGSYVLPGTPGASLGPGTTYESQSPATGGSDSRWQPNGGSGDAPAYEAPMGGTDNPVPNYQDPAGSPADGGFNNPDDYRDTNEFGGQPAPESAPAGGGAEPTTPFNPESPFPESAATGTDGEQFVSVESEMMPVTVVTTVEDERSSRTAPSPYKYDREEFHWLRGVIDYDNDARTWNIIYDIEPDPQDQFGGSIVLSGVDPSESLENGDVVLVDGEVDPKRVDAFGKPMFRVDRLTLLTPNE